MVADVKAEAPAWSEKLMWGALNALERYLFSENFFIANLSPYEEIYRDGIMSVRHYLPLEEDEIQVGDETIPVERVKQHTPLVLVPPLAATSMIFDILPQRSIVRYFLAKGFDVYLIDWGEVTEDHSHLSLETYVTQWMPDALRQIRLHSGREDVSFFSYCMGGLLTLMYAAASQDPNIRNLVTVASPVDMHQSGMAGRVLSLVYRPANIISRVLNFSLMDLPARFLHIPGWVNSLAFKLTNPMGSLISSLELLVNLWDREFVKNHTTMSQWFNDMVDYPGQTIKEMLVKMGLQNQMAKGRMKMGATSAEFSAIKCSILAFAGDADKLVSIKAAHKVLDIVSTEDKEFCVAPGGHAGVFAGGKAPQNVWAISADWLAQRSGEKASQA
ncbi:alpha/beta fold hydrolase [Hahella sp. CR1]|uniref:alpha/beta fold hydrolase n=1 Tax=unclassified Hahella TaxID=2624107 RepID=UPI00244281EC|nr:alpha/beta fold hydrolase [Hahella sp. CR1]MDG9669545.1 alpha/beta fold hydrolase [Hahella sp. CR1]